MSMRVERPDLRSNPWKGLLAGALGGLAGSFAMSQFHSLISPKAEKHSDPNQEDSTALAASAISRIIFRHELTTDQKKLAAPVVHYGFGTGIGAVYGALAEISDSASTGWGTAFGAAAWLGAHVIVVPALGLSKPITQSTLASEAAEFGAHMLYGTVAEGFRRLLRNSF